MDKSSGLKGIGILRGLLVKESKYGCLRTKRKLHYLYIYLFILLLAKICSNWVYYDGTIQNYYHGTLCCFQWVGSKPSLLAMNWFSQLSFAKLEEQKVDYNCIYETKRQNKLYFLLNGWFGSREMPNKKVVIMNFNKYVLTRTNVSFLFIGWYIIQVYSLFFSDNLKKFVLCPTTFLTHFSQQPVHLILIIIFLGNWSCLHKISALPPPSELFSLDPCEATGMHLHL
jgi:hypothetical protein